MDDSSHFSIKMMLFIPQFEKILTKFKSYSTRTFKIRNNVTDLHFNNTHLIVGAGIA
jgi:hypothetical protein